MSEERRKILEMLQQGKVSIDEAEQLLAAVSPSEAAPGTPGTGQAQNAAEAAQSRPRYLHVHVEPDPQSDNRDRVNIRVPLKLIRAGLKWAAFIPKSTQAQVNHALQEKGIDLDLSKLKPEDLEELVANLDDLTVDVEGKEKVRIYCE